MSDDGKVIHAFPGTVLPQNPLQIEKVSDAARYCTHPTVSLNIEERLIHCTKCHSALDPFNFLLQNAKTIQRAWESYAHATSAVNTLNERVSVLKVEESRIRARIKRQQEKKVGTVVNVRGKSE